MHFFVYLKTIMLDDFDSLLCHERLNKSIIFFYELLVVQWYMLIDNRDNIQFRKDS